MQNIQAELTTRYSQIVVSRGCKFVQDVETARRILDVATWIVKGKKNGLILYGTIGSGKSTMAKAILLVLKNHENKVHWTTANDLIKLRLDADYQNKTHATYEGMCKANILIIDELGSENETKKIYGNEEKPIHDMFFQRYDNFGCKTIITTNLDDEGIALHYKERITDRIAEGYSKIGYKQNSYRGN